MDWIQIYYTCLVLIGLGANLVQIAVADSTEKLSKAVFTLIFTIVLAIPIAGRMFNLW